MWRHQTQQLVRLLYFSIPDNSVGKNISLSKGGGRPAFFYWESDRQSVALE
jgi:hypothetical protein